MSEKIPTDETIASIWNNRAFSVAPWAIEGMILWGLRGYAMAARADYDLAHSERDHKHSYCKDRDDWTDDDWLREVAQQKGIEI